MATGIAPRIVLDSEVRFGKRVIKGTRIAVEDVLDLLGNGLTPDQVLKECYPTLTPEDVQASAQYPARPSREG